MLKFNLPSQTKKQFGFSLVEVLLAIALFALFATAFAGAIIYGQQSAVLAGQQGRAVQLAEEGLAATHNIRDENYNNLQDGTYGLAVSAGAWTFSGTSDVTGIFTRQISIVSLSTSTKEITSTVLWQQNFQRTGSVSLVTRLSNWKGE